MGELLEVSPKCQNARTSKVKRKDETDVKLQQETISESVMLE
jgi:hypothetical protein